MLAMGALFEKGSDCVEPNISTAQMWYEKSAERDNIFAIAKMRDMEQCDEKKMYWEEKAVNTQAPMSALVMGAVSHNKDKKFAFSWYFTALKMAYRNFRRSHKSFWHMLLHIIINSPIYFLVFIFLIPVFIKKFFLKKS